MGHTVTRMGWPTRMKRITITLTDNQVTVILRALDETYLDTDGFWDSYIDTERAFAKRVSNKLYKALAKAKI